MGWIFSPYMFYHSLFEEVLWSLAVVPKQWKQVSDHVKLELCSTTFIEVVVQDHL